MYAPRGFLKNWGSGLPATKEAQMKQLETSELFKKRCDIFRAMLEHGSVTCRELQHALKTTNGNTRTFVNSATYVIPFYEDEGCYKLMEE